MNPIPASENLPGNLIAKIGFLKGTWDSGPFDLVFNAPKGGTLLGVMREVNNEKTPYWEFFYFEESQGKLILNPFVMGKYIAEYEWVPDPSDSHTVVFENRNFPEVSRIFFQNGIAENQIKLAVEGEKLGLPYRQEWTFRQVNP